MDYGFAPGLPTDHDEGLDFMNVLRRLFERRGVTNPPDTDPLPASRLVDTKVATLHEFIEHVKAGGAKTTKVVTPREGVVLPMSNALLGAHASSGGTLALPMFPGQAPPKKPAYTTYEVLDETLTNTAATSVDMHELIVDFTGQPTEGFVHIKGCSIGQAKPFMEKLRLALGNVQVTAPRNQYGLLETEQGVFEYLVYEWILRRPSRLVKKKHLPFFTKQAEALAAFRAGGFHYLDKVVNGALGPGDPVGADDWLPWIPKNVQQPKSSSIRPALGAQALERRLTLELFTRFRVKPVEFPFDIGPYANEASVPAPAARRAAFEAAIKANPQFVTAPFSFPERSGFGTPTGPDSPAFNAFLEGHTWEFSKKSVGRGANKRWFLHAHGTRYEYTVAVPITDRSDGRLVFNFHPHEGSTLSGIVQLREDDTRYFARV
jgi:hypothetical protein